MEKRENHAKIIFHIDMNAFFCNVACLVNPSLRGKAFAIGRENTYKGVLSTASYEARKLGIHSAMSLVDAYRILPSLIVVNPDFKLYEDYHHKFVHLIKGYTKKIEVASIDELYADMTEASKTKHPIVLAKEIQMRLLDEFGLPCSIGIAPTLFLAKMASDMKKPLGVTVIRKREIEQILYPVSVKDIFGIGKKTYPKLIENNINTIGEFMNPNNKALIISLIGERAYDYVYSHVKGNSNNIVDPDRYKDSSSISTSETFDIFKDSFDDILFELRKMTKEVCKRIKKEEYVGKTVTITLRDSEFKTIARQKSLDYYVSDVNEVFDIVQELFDENYVQGKSYRLLGVGISNLVHEDEIPKEYNLFTVSSISEKEKRIENIILDFQSRYGKNVLYRKKK